MTKNLADNPGSKKTTWKKLHFTIEGEWFTWMLRHLWVEGSEVKAVRMWIAAFPQFSSKKHIEETFINVVSGRKKFAGTSDEGFALEDDGTKWWSGQQQVPTDKDLPLLDSWEDVLLLKKTKMMIAEIDLQITRTLTQDTLILNRQIRDIGVLWADVRSLAYLRKIDEEIVTIPDSPIGVTSFDISKRFNLTFFESIQQYFKTKYGQSMWVCDLRAVRESIDMLERRLYGLLSKPDYEYPVDQTSAGVLLDNYVSQTIKAAQREKLEPEDIYTTDWESGYISPEGDFYGCANLDHINFALEIANMKGIKLTNSKQATKVLDRYGWVIISMNRIRWGKKRMMDAQKEAIGLFMTGKGFVTAKFERAGADTFLNKELSYDDFMKEAK